MRRSVGVVVIAALILGVSLLALRFAIGHAAGHRTRGLLIAATLMAAIGLIAAEALWSLRSHAFLAYLIWATCAVAALVLIRLHSPAAAHPARIVPQVVYAGIGLGAVAIYLRRAV